MCKSDRFQRGVVFRLCVVCRKLVGCWLFGIKNDCKTCTVNCPFRGAKVSIDGFQMLEAIDSNTSTMCDECNLIAMKKLQKQYPDLKIAS